MEEGEAGEGSEDGAGECSECIIQECGVASGREQGAATDKGTSGRSQETREQPAGSDGTLRSRKART